MNFYSTLDQLVNPTHDMGGAPGGDNSKALAQLILGGGSMSLQDPSTGEMVPMMGQGANMVPDASRAAASPSFKKVLESAEAMAGAVLGKSAGTPSIATPGQGNSLVANPYGPGSFDPTNPAAVAQIQAQGQKAQQVEQARNLLQTLMGNAPTAPGSAVRVARPDELAAFQIESQNYRAKQQQNEPLVKQVLQSLGIGDDAYKKAYDAARGKSEGERAGGKKGKSAIPADLMEKIGKPEFDKRFTEAINNGEITDPNVQLRLETQHNNEIRAARVEGVDRRLLTGLKSSMEGLADLQKSYAETPAFQTGKFSDAMRAALNTNNTAATWEQVVPLPLDGKGFTEADRIFASKYNAVRASLRDFTSDTRFSDGDKLDVLRGIGNPFTGPKQFPLQVQAMQDRLLTRQTNSLNDIEASGRDVSKLRALREGKSAGESGRLPNGKKWTKINGKIMIEE